MSNEMNPNKCWSPGCEQERAHVATPFCERHMVTQQSDKACEIVCDGDAIPGVKCEGCEE